MRKFLRKLVLGLLGAFSSEVLFTNMTPTELFSDGLTLGIYFSLFVLMDEFVQKYNLGNKAIFYLGAIFGLVLEGFFVATIPENPFFQIIFISIVWHGLITVLMSFMIIELFFPRMAGECFNSWWMGIAGMALLAILAFMGIQTLPIILSALPLYAMVGLLILFFTYLLWKEKNKSETYHLRPKLGIMIITSGFAIGTLLQISGFEGKYQLFDHIVRLVITMAILGLIIYKMKKIAHTPLLRDSI